MAQRNEELATQLATLQRLHVRELHCKEVLKVCVFVCMCVCVCSQGCLGVETGGQGRGGAWADAVVDGGRAGVEMGPGRAPGAGGGRGSSGGVRWEGMRQDARWQAAGPRGFGQRGSLVTRVVRGRQPAWHHHRRSDARPVDYS